MDNNYYKYIKYKSKYKSLKRLSLDDVKVLLKKKGKHFYINNKGKLIVKSNSAEKAEKKVLKLISSDINKFLDKSLIYLKYSFWDDNSSSQEDIQLQVQVLIVENVLGKLAITPNDDSNSLITIWLKPDEVNIKDIKSIAKLSLKKKLSNNKDYTYDDIKKMLKK